MPKLEANLQFMFNEYDLLESVIVHRPGVEILKMLPENLDPTDKENYLLFDDILCPSIAGKEHDYFTYVIEEISGKKCFKLMNLLEDVLSNESIKINELGSYKNYHIKRL